MSVCSAIFRQMTIASILYTISLAVRDVACLEHGEFSVVHAHGRNKPLKLQSHIMSNGSIFPKDFITKGSCLINIK